MTLLLPYRAKKCSTYFIFSWKLMVKDVHFLYNIYSIHAVGFSTNQQMSPLVDQVVLNALQAPRISGANRYCGFAHCSTQIKLNWWNKFATVLPCDLSSVWLPLSGRRVIERNLHINNRWKRPPTTLKVEWYNSNGLRMSGWCLKSSHIFKQLQKNPSPTDHVLQAFYVETWAKKCFED